MTKIKKLFLTLASALCCVLCLTLAVLGITSKKNVHAESVTYETATVYDVSQLSSSGPTANTGDVSWFDGKKLNNTTRAFDLPSKGYVATKTATTYTSNSIGVSLKAYTTEANKWSADNKSAIRLFLGYTEVRWYYRALDGGFKFEVFDHAEQGTPNHAKRVNGGEAFYTADFDSTQERTYKVVKSMVAGETGSYKVEIYIGGTLEYEANVSSIAYDNTNALLDRFDLRSASTSDIIIKSAFEPTAVETKDIYDYQAKDEYLSGKALTTSDNWAFGLTNATNGSYGDQDNFNFTFKMKLNTITARNEAFQFRTANFNVRLRLASGTDSAWFNVYDYSNNTWTTISAKVIFSIDEDAENVYSFTRQKLDNGGKVSYLLTLSVNGEVKERIISNFALCQDSSQSKHYGYFDLQMDTARCASATFSSAKYYGVKVDGVMNKVNVGESFTLPTANVETGEVFLGYDNGSALVEAGAKVNEYGEYTTQKLAIANDEKATIRLLHTDESSLKWTTRMDTASYEALVEKFGAENVSFAYEISTTQAEGTINKDITEWATSEDGSAMSVGVILSHIKENHYAWDFTVTIRFSIAYGGATYDFEVADNNNAVSIAEIAEEVYNEEDTPDALKALLSKYFAA